MPYTFTKSEVGRGVSSTAAWHALAVHDSTMVCATPNIFTVPEMQSRRLARIYRTCLEVQSRGMRVCALAKHEKTRRNHIKNWKSGRLWEMTKQGVLNAFYIESQVFNFIPQDLLQPNHFDTRQPSQQIARVFQFNTRNLLSFWIHLWKDKSAGLGRAVIKRYWKLLRLGIPYWPSWNISHRVRSLNANWGTITYQVYPDILKSVTCAIFTSPGTRNGIAKIRKINIHPSSIILTQISNSRPWVAVSGLLKKQSNVLIAKEALSQHLF